MNVMKQVRGSLKRSTIIAIMLLIIGGTAFFVSYPVKELSIARRAILVLIVLILQASVLRIPVSMPRKYLVPSVFIFAASEGVVVGSLGTFTGLNIYASIIASILASGVILLIFVAVGYLRKKPIKDVSLLPLLVIAPVLYIGYLALTELFLIIFTILTVFVVRQVREDGTVHEQRSAWGGALEYFQDALTAGPRFVRSHISIE